MRCDLARGWTWRPAGGRVTQQTQRSGDPQMPDQDLNPERRSNAAILCLSIGFGFMALAWFFGVSGALGLIFSGGWTLAVAGGLVTFLMVPISWVLGVLFVVVGLVWIAIQVIVDQRGAHRTDRYSREVER